MNIVLLLFEGITALDAVGPYEVLSRLPGVNLRIAGPRVGQVRTDNRVLGMHVDVVLDDIEAADVLLVPGGYGVDGLIRDPAVLAHVRRLDAGARYTTAVCTGSLVLGAAGLLHGLEATTHWARFDTLASYGATPVSRRVVTAGRIVTAAGVSAGIDMALTLAAGFASPDVAQAIQLAIEYDPQPPFDSGHPRSAPAEVVARVTAAIDRKRAASAA